MKTWSEDLKKYELGEGLTLERAKNNREFSVFYNIYRIAILFSESIGVKIWVL